MSDKRLSRVIASTPANQTAARVIARGIHYAPPEKLRPQDSTYSGELPPLVNVPRGKRNHTGLVVGDLSVIGYLGDHFDKDGQSKHSRWLVRCRCGVYEHRKGASLGRLAKSGDLWSARCWECTNLARLRGQKPASDQWQGRPHPIVPLLPGANDVFSGGEKFGRLTVIGYGGSGGGNGARWIVRCDCGQFGRMTSAGLKRGRSPQCERCYRVEMAGGQP